MSLNIRKAERRRAKARIALCGPAGSGKTHSSLLLASGLGQKIVVIDTERRSSEWEQGKANMPEFSVCEINEPFTAKKYIEAIKECEAQGFDVIIIDSLSHAWAGSGGLLDKQGEAADRLKNSYTAWREVTPDHNRLVEAMLQSTAHVIATMRSKTDYVLETNERGKQQPKKVGLAPIQREGMDYEFTLVFDIDRDTHVATDSKNRLEIFQKFAERLTKAHGEELLVYVNSGAAPEPTAAQAHTPAPNGNSVLTWDKTEEGLKLLDEFRVITGVSNLSDDERFKWERHFLAAPSLEQARIRYNAANSKLNSMTGATA